MGPQIFQGSHYVNSEMYERAWYQQFGVYVMSLLVVGYEDQRTSVAPPPPPPPPTPTHPTHHPPPHNPIPHPDWVHHVVRCGIDPSTLDPEIKNRIIVANLTINIGLALTHGLNRLCPKLQYICSLSSSMINIHHPTNDYDYPPSKIVQ